MGFRKQFTSLCGAAAVLSGSILSVCLSLSAWGQDLPVATATYIGGPTADRGDSVDIAPDGTVVWAGKVEGNDFGLTATPLLGGGTGVVLRLAADGSQVLSVSRIGAEVLEARVNQTDGTIVVCGAFGIAVLDADAGSVLWSNSAVGSVIRVAIAADGTVAALKGPQSSVVTIFDSRGNQIGTTSPNPVWFTRDVALDAGTQQFFISGDYNTKLPSGLPVRIAYLRAYSYDGTFTWQNYAYGGGQLTGYEADTIGDRVSMGRDGNLYFLGGSAGGNTIFSRSPRDLTVPAPNVTTDKYTNPYNTKSNTFAYFACFRPADGSMQRGQFLLPRRPGDDLGNTMTRASITADENGNVYLCGAAAANIVGRDALTIAGIPVPPYSGDAYVAEISADFQTRKIWTTWGSGTTTDVAAGLGFAAMAATTGSATPQGYDGPLITVYALLPAPTHALSSSSPIGFLSTWPAQ